MDHESTPPPDADGPGRPTWGQAGPPRSGRGRTALIITLIVVAFVLLAGGGSFFFGGQAGAAGLCGGG
jgi:hypothetical protein